MTGKDSILSLLTGNNKIISYQMIKIPKIVTTKIC